MYIDGKARFLGRFDDPQTKTRYDQLMARWLDGGRKLIEPDQAGVFIVKMLVEAFMDHARAYYRRHDGKPTTEVNTFERATNELNALYGGMAAAEFGPNALRAPAVHGQAQVLAG